MSGPGGNFSLAPPGIGGEGPFPLRDIMPYDVFWPFTVFFRPLLRPLPRCAPAFVRILILILLPRLLPLLLSFSRYQVGR